MPKNSVVAIFQVDRYDEKKAHVRNLQGDVMKFMVSLIASEEGYSVSVPSLPGCWSQGATEAEAMVNIADAIREYLAAEMPTREFSEIREIDFTRV